MTRPLERRHETDPDLPASVDTNEVVDRTLPAGGNDVRVFEPGVVIDPFGRDEIEVGEEPFDRPGRLQFANRLGTTSCDLTRRSGGSEDFGFATTLRGGFDFGARLDGDGEADRGGQRDHEIASHAQRLEPERRLIGPVGDEAFLIES